MKFKTLMLVSSLFISSAFAMNKGEFIDAIAKDAKLTKADSQRALDAFIRTTSKSLIIIFEEVFEFKKIWVIEREPLMAMKKVHSGYLIYCAYDAP